MLTAVVGVACSAPPASRAPAGGPVTAPPSAQTSARPEGLSAATALVTAFSRGRTVRLDAPRARAALDAVWQVLGDAPAVAPVAGGPRLLAVLRVNEQVLDVTIWKQQTLIVAARRLRNASAVLVPVTGTWRHRVLVVQVGAVVASPVLVDSPALAAIDDLVRTAVGPR